jgi:hypothetical protein
MRRLLPLFLLLFAAASAISAAEPRVSRAVIAGAEKSFDGRVVSLWNDALALVGPTRGFYLEGVGVIITAEVNLAMPPVSLMNPKPTPQQMVDLHKTKLERLPQLRASMKTALMEAAASFAPMPPGEEVVLYVLMPRFPGEDTSGLPMQLIMRANKQKLLDARNAKGAGLDQAVAVTEH